MTKIQCQHSGIEFETKDSMLIEELVKYVMWCSEQACNIKSIEDCIPCRAMELLQRIAKEINLDANKLN